MVQIIEFRKEKSIDEHHDGEMIVIEYCTSGSLNLEMAVWAQVSPGLAVVLFPGNHLQTINTSDLKSILRKIR